MLDRANFPTPTIAAPQRVRQLPSIRVIDAQNLAKAHRSIAERAYLAAKWITGGAVIENRTATLAAMIFGASAGSIHRALAELDPDPDGVEVARLRYAWDHTSAEGRASFVRGRLDSVWITVEQVTR